MGVLMRNKSNIYGLVGDLTTLTNNISSEVTRATSVEGNLASLTTTNKSSLVSAINEINAATGSEAVALIEAETLRATTAEGTIATNLASEVTRATIAEGLLDGRLDIIESSVISGTFWQASFDTVEVLESNLTGAESTTEIGWAYYVKSNNNAYVVVNDTDGDYIPATWTTKSLIIFADYTELSGLVSTETTRATNVENAIKTELDNTQTGAGLASNGDYSADDTTNYLTTASSLKDADKKLDAALKSLDDKIVLGGAVFITELLTVTSDLITLTYAPKNGVIFNFATVRYVDNNYASWDIPVIVTATVGGKEFLLSPDSSGQFDTKSVIVQYAYIPIV